MISDLENLDMPVHLVQSNSSMADIYIHDTLRRVYNASVDSVITVDDKRSVAYMFELLNLMPYNADKWIFEINWKKAGKYIPKNSDVFKSETSVFVINVEYYKDFKEVNGFLKSCNQLYLSFIKHGDVKYLLRECDLTEKLKDFVAYTYAREPEKIFTLRKEMLEGGKEILNQKDIVKLLGASASSVLNFVLLLLNDGPKTERGEKMVYRKRVQTGLDLINAYGVSTFRNYLNSTVYDLLQLKILYLEGVVYDRVRDLPDGYDEKKLSRYGYCLNKIEHEIPYNKLLRLYSILQSKENKRWYSEEDFLSFIYSYYSEMGNVVVGGARV